MIKDIFQIRGQALEDEFFRRVDQQLLASLRAKTTARAERQKLEASTGFTDECLLDELMAIGVTAESAAAMSLVPLIMVAWADGKMNLREHAIIMKTAESYGIAAESPAAKLLDHWLRHKPKPELASTWRRYLAVLIKKLSEEGRLALRSDVINGARSVARATGGVLGFRCISSDEQSVIAELNQVFDDNPTAIASEA